MKGLAGLLSGQKMQGLMNNPALYAGLGLLSQNGRASGALQGLGAFSQVQGQQETQALRKQMLEQRQQQAANQAANQQATIEQRKAEHELKKQQLAQQMQMAQSRAMSPTANMRDFEHRQGLSSEDGAAYDQMFARQQNTPAILQEQAWLSDPTRTPEQIDNYWRSKRAGQLIDTGGGGIDRLGPDNTRSTLVNPEDATKLNAAEAAAKAEQSKLANIRGDAQGQLAGMDLEVADTTSFVDQLRNHPGRATATGFSSNFNFLHPTGSDPADFVELLETAKGKAFSVAYNTLKGGGTITEVETDMATKALANLKESQSEGQFNAALDRFESAVLRGYKKLQAKSQVGLPAKSAPAMDTKNAPEAFPGLDVGTVQDGYTYLGGDPSDPKSWRQ